MNMFPLKCLTILFNTSSIDILLSVSFSADGTINSISGSAMAKNPSEPAKLLVSFFESKDP